jgi:hypothetical protein
LNKSIDSERTKGKGMKKKRRKNRKKKKKG